MRGKYVKHILELCLYKLYRMIIDRCNRAKETFT